MLFTHPVASRVGVGPEGSCPPRGGEMRSKKVRKEKTWERGREQGNEKRKQGKKDGRALRGSEPSEPSEQSEPDMSEKSETASARGGDV